MVSNRVLLADNALHQVVVPVQEGASETEIGAVRCSKMGKDCQIFEQLVGIDDEDHTMYVLPRIKHTERSECMKLLITFPGSAFL